MTLEAGIVGIGRWGRRLVDSMHGDLGSPIRFVAGTTRTPERARDWAGERGIELLPDLGALLARPRLAAVVLATPHRQHADQAVAAARAGLAVFVEKPFAMSLAEGLAMAEACRSAGVVLALGHDRRFLPGVARLRALLEGGRLGTLLHLEAHFSGPGADRHGPGAWRGDPAESPLGGMAAMGVHVLDLLIALAGPLDTVSVLSQARVLTNGLDDATAMLGRHRAGPLCTLATLSLSPRAWRLALHGTEGWAELAEERRLTVRLGAGAAETSWLDPFDTLRAELRAFADAVARRAPYPLPVAEALAGAAAFEAMRRAAAAGGPVAVPDPGWR